MKKFIIAFIFALFLLGCKHDAQTKSPSSNANIEVDLLFEHDGCKVYRFYDGRYVYYTDCRGTTQSSYQSGKQTYYTDVANSGKK